MSNNRSIRPLLPFLVLNLVGMGAFLGFSALLSFFWKGGVPEVFFQILPSLSLDVSVHSEAFCDLLAFAISIAAILLPGFLLLQKRTGHPQSAPSTGAFLILLGWGACAAAEFLAFFFFSPLLSPAWAFRCLLALLFAFVNFIWIWFFNSFGELTRYLVGGFLTTLVSFGGYYTLTRLFSWKEMTAQVGSWVLAVLFGYAVNKLWVFHRQQKDWKGLLKEFWNFVFGRLLTSAILEWGLFWVMLHLFQLNDLIVKAVTLVLVVIANYIWSKRVAFREDSAA